MIVTGGFDLGPAVSEQEFHDWYDKEVCSSIDHVDIIMFKDSSILKSSLNSRATSAQLGTSSSNMSPMPKRGHQRVFHLDHKTNRLENKRSQQNFMPYMSFP